MRHLNTPDRTQIREVAFSLKDVQTAKVVLGDDALVLEVDGIAVATLKNVRVVNFADRRSRGE